MEIRQFPNAWKFWRVLPNLKSAISPLELISFIPNILVNYAGNVTKEIGEALFKGSHIE